LNPGVLLPAGEHTVKKALLRRAISFSSTSAEVTAMGRRLDWFAAGLDTISTEAVYNTLH
jgi:hypothetical protein